MLKKNQKLKVQYASLSRIWSRGFSNLKTAYGFPTGQCTHPSIWHHQTLLFIDVTNQLTVRATTKGPSKRRSVLENCTSMDVVPAAFQKIVQLNSCCLVIALHLLFDECLHLISDFSMRLSRFFAWRLTFLKNRAHLFTCSAGFPRKSSFAIVGALFPAIMMEDELLFVFWEDHVANHQKVYWTKCLYHVS